MLRSLIVAAPAGSGKTEELSRRYIDLLEANVPPERILTLTFTEKAAAEMKERILKRLRENHPDIYVRVRENILRLRISTFHSFCLSLLRRFAPHVGLDPALEALDESGAAELWQRALYDTLSRIAAETDTPDYRTLMELVTGEKTQEWGKLTKRFGKLYAKRAAVEHAMLAPVVAQDFHALRAELADHRIGQDKVPGLAELFPRTPSPDAVAEALARLEDVRLIFENPGGGPDARHGTPDEKAWNKRMHRYHCVLRMLARYREFNRMFDLFRRRFLTAYDSHKLQSGTVDFEDMEYRALKIISEDDQWQNILYAFDEQTDHLLVDEFQDTSFIQWAIMRRLIEEWLSGEGAKTDRGVEPSIFIVGDVKQSIYLFRDAKVELFSRVRDELRAAPAVRLEEKPIKYNYRSLQAVIDFTNTLFSRLMSETENKAEPWRTPYEPFQRGRRNDAPGRVEILLDRSDGNMGERRPLEAEMICRRIQSLIFGAEPLVVYERPAKPDAEETPRACGYGDIAILVRDRTHLRALAEALHRHAIPFVTVGGKGFYSEPEVCHLKDLLSFLVDPSDNVSLYGLLRGPLFSVPERDIMLAGLAPGRSFWDRLRACAVDNPGLGPVVAALGAWLGRTGRHSLAAIIERALSERQAWKTFWEPQRIANIRKFLHIVETMEIEGRHPLRILEFLEGKPDEKRADVSVETSRAAQVMTIHGAKGLQFPIVFCAGGDVGIGKADKNELLIEERSAQEAWVSFLPGKDGGRLRKENSFHTEFRDKEWEEEKRVFYVACTRATDALFLTGIWQEKGKKDTTLHWLTEHLGLREDGAGFRLDTEIPSVYCLSAAEIPDAAPRSAAKKRPKLPIHTAPLSPEPAPTIRSVTRDLAADFRDFGEDAVGTGEVIHKLLEMVSNGMVVMEGTRLAEQTERLLRLGGLPASLSDSVQSAVRGLRSTPVREVVKPQPDSFAELPVMYSDGKTLWTGRVDRVIVTKDEVRIYDYKTFPVKKKDLPRLARAYHDGQLRHYAAALLRIYPGRKARTFLVFTSLPVVFETDDAER